ncbi:MAG: hypothetical protein ISP89_08585 [Pseudomonadales bacterium]|nr:hypothetical protein [Pseudomonadales bacterium]
MRALKMSHDSGHLAASACWRGLFARLFLSALALGFAIIFVPSVALSQSIQDGSSLLTDANAAGVPDSLGIREEQAEPVAAGAGREAESVDESAAEGNEESVAESAAAAARSLEISREIARREALIEELRYSSGVYSDQLREVQADLGAYLIEMEDFEGAAKVYSEALQITRINTGLYSEEQLPVIKALIASNTKSKAWAEADDFQSLHLHIASRLYSKTDGRFLAAARQYGDWRFRVMSENLLDDSYQGLARTAEELSAFYGAVIVALETEGQEKSGELLDFVFSKAETDMVLIRAIASTPYTDFPGTVSPYVYRSRCRNVRDANGQVVQQCTNIQVENPRYRQSQRDAKQVAVNRQVRSIREAIERIERLRDSAPLLDRDEVDVLDSRIARLELETQQMLRQARSRSLF